MNPRDMAKDEDECSDRCPVCKSGKCIKAWMHFGNSNHVGSCGHTWK